MFLEPQFYLDEHEYLTSEQEVQHYVCPHCGCEFEASVPECPSCLNAFYEEG
jgi:rubrerythrin